MQTACLYIRVSTDEQAIRGYSQRSQQDRLEKYCLAHDIKITDTVFEDHSAKTFKRPAWSEMMSRFKKHPHSRTGLLLFTKWDRFSRNAGDAYYIINQLRNLGIQPQAIDQALDLSVPENKIMLAAYLATSEAENERRSLNIRQGIHKAKKEGRVVTKVPFGYTYRHSPEGEKSVYPKEPEATFVRKAYGMLAEGYDHIQSVYDYLISCGMKCSKSNFWRVIRSPFYYGHLVVPAFENEKAFCIKGTYEPLISEELFHEVQEKLNFRKRKLVIRNTEEILLLRHFFYCPVCTKKLTGSASKGRSKRYYYYHCRSGCRFRIRADMANEFFLNELKKLNADTTYIDIYKSILKHMSKELFAEKATTQQMASQSIDRLINRILKAKELLIAGEIEADDFQTIKAECETRISMLGTELQNATLLAERKESNFNKAVSYWIEPGKLFQELQLIEKEKFLEIMLSQAPVLHNQMVIQNIVHYAAQAIYKLDKGNNIQLAFTIGKMKELDDSYMQELIAKIKQTAAVKRRDISIEQCEMIIRFLAAFAKLTIENL